MRMRVYFESPHPNRPHEFRYFGIYSMTFIFGSIKHVHGDRSFYNFQYRVDDLLLQDIDKALVCNRIQRDRGKADE